MCAQEKPPENSGAEQGRTEAAAPALPDRPAPQIKNPATHRFWDRQNLWLFAGVAAGRALDFHSTGNMRRRGREEILLTNAVVDNKPAFVAIEAAGALVSVGISYWFHRTGHHKLERWTSIIHIGVGMGGAVRNYSLRSHPRMP